MAAAKPEVTPWFKIDDQPGLRFLKEQLAGLDLLRELAPRASILDLGCAEGLIGKYYVDTCGADLLHGLEAEESRVAKARELCAGYEHAQFWPANLNDRDSIDATLPLLAQYDIVLLLAILHKLKDPIGCLRWAAARAGKIVAIRMPQAAPVFRDQRSGDVKVRPIEILADEFKLIAQGPGPRNEWTGIWQRK